MKPLISLLTLSLILLGLSLVAPAARPRPQTDDPLWVSGEKHLRNIKQLTFGGENAEAYFSSDDKKLIFQSTRDGHGCDQIYTMNSDGSDVKMISNGDGR